MRENKFQYTVITGSGHIMSETFPMGDIENGRVIQWMKANHISDDTCQIHRSEFTGLLDKNGKEIYEGDIIEVTDGDGWNLGSIVVNLDPGYVCQLDIDDRCIGEIIGNIHENPELLETT